MKKSLKGDRSREVYFERLDKIVKRKNKKSRLQWNVTL